MTGERAMTRPERDFYERIGQRIKAARRDRRLTQRDLGMRLGVTSTAISYWENAHHAPTLWHLRQIERALGVEVVL